MSTSTQADSKQGAVALANLREHEYNLPKHLAEQGLHGVRNQCALCPIARYLLRKTDAVDVETQSYYSTLVYADGSREHVDHPDFVEWFVLDFDDERYPELELPSATR